MNDRAERLGREARRWMRLAREDMASADHLAANPELSRRLPCYLAQQAAEKAINAVLVAEDVDPPKLHDLRRLVQLSRSSALRDLTDLELEELGRWSIAGRYPANLEEATAEDTLSALATGRRVLDAAERALTETVGPAQAE